MDAVASVTIRDLLSGFVAKGSTVFLTSHVLDIVERLCSHVGIIMSGKIILQTSMEEIRAKGSLEKCFLEVAGADTSTVRKLDWLEQAEQPS